jgi:hypothetical protein
MALTKTCVASKYFGLWMLKILQLVGNKQMYKDLSSASPSHDLVAFGFTVWLIICDFIWCRHLPSPFLGESSRRRLRSLVLVAVRVAEVSNIPVLDRNVAYWEAEIRSFNLNHLLRVIPKGEELFVHKFRNSKERQLSETLNRQGIHPLANLLVNIELAVSKSPLLEVIAKDRRGTVDAMTEMFLSMDRQLLNTVIEGRVIEQFQRNGKNNIREVLQRIEYKNNKHPGTYAHYFVDDAGMSPTAEHLSLLATDIRRYVSFDSTPGDNEWATDVDQIFSPPSDWNGMNRRGGRRYRDWSPKKKDDPRPNYWPKSAKRRDRFIEFAEKLDSRVSDQRRKKTNLTPLQPPLSEIGYSIHPKQRIKAHASHISSNRMMNLVQALSFTRFGDSFKMRPIILYTCFTPMQAWLSEIAFSHLSQSSTKDGQGFNDYVAGRSNVSAYNTYSRKQFDKVKKSLFGDFRREMLASIKVETKFQKQRQTDSTLEKEDTKEMMGLMDGICDIEKLLNEL